MGAPTIIEQINKKWGGTAGVIFGQPGDPYANRYAAFNQLLGNIQQAELQVTKAIKILDNPNAIRPLLTADDLRFTPESMQLPILLYAPVRALLEADRITGYDIDPASLPEEDCYARLINNGTVDLAPVDPKAPVSKQIVWEFDGLDPDVTLDDLYAIEKTRNFIDTWLEAQLGAGGKRLDPTDPDNRIRPIKKS